MKTAIVIGSGAGGAMVAKELQGHFQVTLLEAGGEFRPFPYSTSRLAGLRKTGLLFNEQLIHLLFPQMRIAKTPDMVLVRGEGHGGTTTLATGNAVRYDADLRAIGIDLDQEFAELYAEIPITTDHRKHWSSLTKQLFGFFEDLGLAPTVTPKMMVCDKCTSCGCCSLGCRFGAKWDARALIRESIRKGAQLVSKCRVERLEIQAGSVTRVWAVEKGKSKPYAADLIILAAGGLGTPVILDNSGIPCKNTLFVDPVLCVAAPMQNAQQNKQILMPFISQQEKYILSPYFDYLSFFFNKAWRLPPENLVSLMIKLADASTGFSKSAGMEKTLTAEDKASLQNGVELCQEILSKLGVDQEDTFLGTINAGHPGGMLPLTRQEAVSFHHEVLPCNLYIADATLFPKSLGNPPILTIMALAKRIARICINL